MILRRVLPLAALLLIAASCRTTPLDNVWPGCRPSRSTWTTTPVPTWRWRSGWTVAIPSQVSGRG